jgi:hypothetical protein
MPLFAYIRSSSEILDFLMVWMEQGRLSGEKQANYVGLLFLWR